MRTVYYLLHDRVGTFRTPESHPVVTSRCLHCYMSYVELAPRMVYVQPKPLEYQPDYTFLRIIYIHTK